VVVVGLRDEQERVILRGEVGPVVIRLCTIGPDADLADPAWWRCCAATRSLVYLRGNPILDTLRVCWTHTQKARAPAMVIPSRSTSGT